MPEPANRIALIIGNADYLHAPRLANPLNDAVAVAEAFKRLDFKIDLHRNLGLMELGRALARFSEASNHSEMAVVYFAGHGLEIDGTNYLVPVDAQLDEVGSVRFETRRLDDVLSVVHGAKSLQLVILDACRDNPFVGRMRGLEGTRSITARGLSIIEPTGNTLVWYAAKHGTKAHDGALGGNSPFAEALVQHIESPDLEIGLLFGNVTDTVREKTHNLQEPHQYGARGGNPIYLKGGGVVGGSGSEEALRYYETVLVSRDLALIQAWLRDYGPQVAEFKRELVRAHRDTLRKAEEADWQRACKQNDEEAYQQYLELWPTAGPHSAEANSCLATLKNQRGAHIAWTALCETDNVAAQDDFLEKFPDSQYASLARSRRSDLAHRREWHDVLINSRDPDHLQQFILNYPNGPFTAAAQSRLDAVRDEASKKQVEQQDRGSNKREANSEPPRREQEDPQRYDHQSREKEEQSDRRVGATTAGTYTPIWKLIALSWKPTETHQQTKTMIFVGTGGLGVLFFSFGIAYALEVGWAVGLSVTIILATCGLLWRR